MLQAAATGSDLSAAEQRVGIDGDALPPFLVRAQDEDGEVQVWAVGTGIAGAADIADDIAAPKLLAFRQGRRIEIGRASCRERVCSTV